MKMLIGLVALLTTFQAMAETFRIDKSNLKTVDYSIEPTGINSPICGQIEYRHHLTIQLNGGAVVRLDRNEHGCEAFDFEEPAILAQIKGQFVGKDDRGAYEYVYFVVADSKGSINSGSITKQYLNTNCSR